MVFHLWGGGGVLPPNSLLLADNDDEKFDDDLPPLVSSEEADLPQLSLETRVEAPPQALNQEEKRRIRPPRQLRSRSVARFVAKDRRVRFSKKLIVWNKATNIKNK